MRQGAYLTDVFLRKMKAPERAQVDVWDRALPGFGVRCSRAGTKTFVLVYRTAGKWRRLSIGRYPVISLQEARRRASTALLEVSAGKDPQAPKETARTQARENFASVVDEFVVKHCKRHNRASTAAETERILKAVFVPLWRDRPIRAITSADVTKVTEGIMARGAPSAACHAFAAIRLFFNWCEETGAVEVSPCLRLKPPIRANSRDRVLNDDELAAVLSAAATIGYPFGPIVTLRRSRHNGAARLSA